MVEVSLVSSLRPAVGGLDRIDVEARTIRELLTKLVARYPSLQEHLDAGIAVAVNGEIYRDNRELEIPAQSEVYLMPRIKGG